MNAPDPAAKRGYRMSARATSAERTRDRIADAMLDRFAVTPYEHIRLDDVAADAGVTVQTVIRRFGGKAGLLLAVVERELGRIADARETVEGESVDTTLAALVQHYERYGDLILKTYSESPLVPGLPELAAAGRAYHVGWCRRVFADRLDPGLDDAARIRRLAQIVVICDATTWRILRDDGPLDAEECRRALHELLTPVFAPA
ncbi:TetR/AcrR family transcriptional regulator [Herbiconiux daphne]|uniref:TetR/AcrR family transcriptional regulator n=1 Tax=Herbiconiux daphne TaxID=2970914 RepID=A0ABT2H7I3_9MICO|nr:TetR/AcrR family transcriptional regulator [Herbiconiux daphne]MCS5735872.1 TetR/AcrR family transcriptional regulator [Herbiconiux daphne]